MSLSSAVKKRLAAAALGVGLSSAGLLAGGSRCVDCGECSESQLQCGYCIWFAVVACCDEWSPGAYAVCDGNEWFAFCDGPGGPVTFCGEILE